MTLPCSATRVQCCFAAYERSLDGIVGMFIPFYNEIKALVIGFFLLTRARVSFIRNFCYSAFTNFLPTQGAEPIYLHVLRPMIKPYTETLDALLEFIQQLGDLIAVLCAIPISIVSPIYHRFFSRKEPAPPEIEDPVIPPKPEDFGRSEFGETRSRKRALHNAHAKATAASSGSQVHTKESTKATHEIWHPPPPAYDESPRRVSAGLPTPPSEDQMGAPKHPYVDEWRQYEAFPAAYPATPLHTTSGLPSTLPPDYAARLASMGGITEEADETHEQSFYMSLQSPRESPNPDSDGALSDDHYTHPGVHTDDEMSVDEEDYEEEDDFDVTLRTPYPLSRIMNVSGMTADSQATDDSTGLDTIDDGSPLQTRTNSTASSSSQPDSPTAGRKRRAPSPTRLAKDVRPVVPRRSTAQDTIRARPASTRPPLSRLQTKEETDATEGGDDTIKKRRAAPTSGARRLPVRQPIAKQAENKPPLAARRPAGGAAAARAPVRAAARPAQGATGLREAARRRPGEAVKEVA